MNGSWPHEAPAWRWAGIDPYKGQFIVMGLDSERTGETGRWTVTQNQRQGTQTDRVSLVKLPAARGMPSIDFDRITTDWHSRKENLVVSKPKGGGHET